MNHSVTCSLLCLEWCPPLPQYLLCLANSYLSRLRRSGPWFQSWGYVSSSAPLWDTALIMSLIVLLCGLIRASTAFTTPAERSVRLGQELVVDRKSTHLPLKSGSPAQITLPFLHLHPESSVAKSLWRKIAQQSKLVPFKIL